MMSCFGQPCRSKTSRMIRSIPDTVDTITSPDFQLLRSGDFSSSWSTFALMMQSARLRRAKKVHVISTVCMRGCCRSDLRMRPILRDVTDKSIVQRRFARNDDFPASKSKRKREREVL